jgi:hypothetical protein
MNRQLYNPQRKSIMDDEKTYKKLELNHARNKEQDMTRLLDEASAQFRYQDCKEEFWNPESFSLLYKTPLWDQASHAQRIKLNQLYWVAYYSQRVSTEIATIYFNQVCASALYGLEDFRLVCDALDLETSQGRAHIAAFKKVSEDFEAEVFGERLFTFPMRTPFRDVMLYSNRTVFMKIWKRWQNKAYSLLSSNHAFIASQHFTVRGLRALNAKLVEQQLAQHYMKYSPQEQAPIPMKVSYFHFMNESFHFNSSTIIGLDVVNSLKEPTLFERRIANKTIQEFQREQFHFSTVLRGISWFDPAMFKTVYRLLRSPIFAMTHSDSMYMMRQCFTKETEGAQLSFEMHQAALKSYREYIDDLRYVSKGNREMIILSGQTFSKHMKTNRKVFERFEKRQLDLLPVINGPKARLQPLELS